MVYNAMVNCACAVGLQLAIAESEGILSKIYKSSYIIRRSCFYSLEEHEICLISHQSCRTPCPELVCTKKLRRSVRGEKVSTFNYSARHEVKLLEDVSTKTQFYRYILKS